MNRIIISNLWQALGRIYLTDSELINANPASDNKKILYLIKKRFFESIWQKMRKYNEESPPFLENKDFISLGCKSIIKETEDINWGKIELHDDHFVVNINKNLSYLKKRTVLAHEIGHTFLYDTQTRPIKEIYHRERSLDLLSSNVYDEDEGFVYEIGRYLLIPKNAIQHHIPKKPSIDAFLQSCALFQTTKDVMAKRLFWDIYDYERNEKFWKSALLIFYPFEDSNGELVKIPKGGKYIFRGSIFKNFQIEKYWYFILPSLRSSIDKPEVEINNVLIDPKKQKYLFFKKSKIALELKYLPKDRRVYILITSI